MCKTIQYKASFLHKYVIQWDDEISTDGRQMIDDHPSQIKKACVNFKTKSFIKQNITMVTKHGCDTVTCLSSFYLSFIGLFTSWGGNKTKLPEKHHYYPKTPTQISNPTKHPTPHLVSENLTAGIPGKHPPPWIRYWNHNWNMAWSPKHLYRW